LRAINQAITNEDNIQNLTILKPNLRAINQAITNDHNVYEFDELKLN